jgi:hypothetical protein
MLAADGEQRRRRLLVGKIAPRLQQQHAPVWMLRQARGDDPAMDPESTTMASNPSMKLPLRDF